MLKHYAVTVTFKYPASGSKEGPPLRVIAKDHSGAIKAARSEMRHRGYDRHDGPITYRAKVVRDVDPEDFGEHGMHS